MILPIGGRNKLVSSGHNCVSNVITQSHDPVHVRVQIKLL